MPIGSASSTAPPVTTRLLTAALELRIGQRVRVPPEREAGRRKGQDRRRVERDGHDHDGRQRHEGHECQDDEAERHGRRPGADATRFSPASSASVTTSGQQGERAGARPVERVEPQVLDHAGDHLDLAAPEQLGRRERAEGPREDDQAAGQDSGQRQRERHAPEDAVGPAPRLAAALVHRIDVTDRRRQQQDHRRHREVHEPTSTPRSVNSIGTGHVTTVLPSTSIHGVGAHDRAGEEGGQRQHQATSARGARACAPARRRWDTTRRAPAPSSPRSGPPCPRRSRGSADRSPRGSWRA